MRVLRAGAVILIFLGFVAVVTLLRQDHETIRNDIQLKSAEAVQELNNSWDPLVIRVDTLETRTNRLESKVDAWVERK